MMAKKKIAINNIELKLAYRYLIKHPIRTIFTLLSIILGVSIFFSINIATDSLEQSLYEFLDPNMHGNVDTWINLLRGILMIISAISLIVCVIIIKNIMETSREAQIYELGLLRAIGTTKRSIFLIYFYQIIIISIIGVILGLLVGYFLSGLFFGPLKTVMSRLLSLETDFTVQLYFTPLTLVISTITGLIIPILFGIIPTYRAAKVNILSALNPHLINNNTKKNKLYKLIVKIICSIFLIVLGIILINIGFSGLLSFASDPTMVTNISMIYLFLATFIFIIGSVFFSSIFFPYISLFFSSILKPFLLKMKKICNRNLIKNLRRSKNTFLIISIVISFLIAMKITLSSLDAGINPGARMRIGGDIRIGMQYGSHQIFIPINTSEYISQIDHVSDVCEVKNSYKYYLWEDNLQYNGTTCDEFGIFRNEQIMLIVINTTSYVNMHSENSIVRYLGNLSFYEFIHALDENNTVILQNELAKSINKNIGDNVNITTEDINDFPAITSNLTVVGIADILPGIEFTWYNPNPDMRRTVAVISWNTYFNITGQDRNETTGYFWIGCDDLKYADSVLEDIEELYQNLGDPWTEIDFDNNYWIIRTILDEINQMEQILNLIFMVIISVLYMTLIVSMLGLANSMIMGVYQRKNELGIMRALGTSKIQTLQLIAGEILIIGLASIIIGIICGFSTGYLISNVPFMPYLPLIFTINSMDIFYISISSLILCLVSSVIPAIKAVRTNIIENIQIRGLK